MHVRRDLQRNDLAAPLNLCQRAWGGPAVLLGLGAALLLAGGCADAGSSSADLSEDGSNEMGDGSAPDWEDGDPSAEPLLSGAEEQPQAQAHGSGQEWELWVLGASSERGAQRLTVLDGPLLETGLWSELERLSLPALANETCGHPPPTHPRRVTSVALSADHSHLFAHFAPSGEVLLVDAEAREAVACAQVPADPLPRPPLCTALVSPDGSALFLPLAQRGEVLRLRTALSEPALLLDPAPLVRIAGPLSVACPWIEQDGTLYVPQSHAVASVDTAELSLSPLEASALPVRARAAPRDSHAPWWQRGPDTSAPSCLEHGPWRLAGVGGRGPAGAVIVPVMGPSGAGLATCDRSGEAARGGATAVVPAPPGHPFLQAALPRRGAPASIVVLPEQQD
jgi:hypothetical protein